MQRILQLSILFFSLSIILACRQTGEESTQIQRLEFNSLENTAPYLTTDHKGNTVLCWTAKDPADSLNRLMYAVYDTEKEQFGAAVTVPVSAGTKVSAECMNKIGFKSDGTILAFFAKRFENEKNKYAGAICYSMSADDGVSWSPAQYLHSDTSHAYGRGYFDIARLNSGEIGAIWLDGRFHNTSEGSAIFFASTQKGAGFAKEICISKSTCECCRTDLLADDEGNIHIAYRSIRYPDALMGKQTRDMVYTFSSDNGSSFTPEKVISHDNWAIEGCPHTGPSLAINGSGVNAAWFTAGGAPGLYYSFKAADAADFKSRDLITVTGRHPQMVSLPDGRLLMVYEEAVADDHRDAKHSAEKHGGTDHGSAAEGSRIVIRSIVNGKAGSSQALTDGTYADHHAVMIPVQEGLLVAWVREENGRPGIYYSKIRSL